MSGLRLIFAFKDGLNLALNEEDAPQGGIIDFDMKFNDINVDYEDPLMNVVDEREKEGLPSLLKFSNKSFPSVKGKEIIEEHDPMEGPSHRLPSMVATAAGNLVAADDQKIPFASLRRTRRRNADRKKQRALARERKQKAKLSEIPEEQFYGVNMKETPESLPSTEEEVQSEQYPVASSTGMQSNATSICSTYHSVTPVQGSSTGAFVECLDCNVLHLERYCSFDEFLTTQQQPFDYGNQYEEAYMVPLDPWDVVPYPLMGIEAYDPIEMIPAPTWVPVEEDIPQENIRYPLHPDGEELSRIHEARCNTFEHFERVNRDYVNVLEGLELYTDVFSTTEEEKILDCVFDLKDRGRAGLLYGRTYSEPKKWMRGKGRITIQCGCCYNYKIDRQGILPGILQHERVEPMPPTIKWMVTRMIRWGILPPNCIPNSCIINIYEEGDCIPPHIDHHDFERPFCTASFLAESDILFGTEIDIISPGEFRGSVKVSLPRRSVLVLNGNGADLVKHCIPGVRQRRVSITFRRMNDDKTPYGFQPDPELEELQPYEL